MARPLSTISSSVFPVTGPSPRLLLNASPHNGSAQLALRSSHFSVRIIRPNQLDGVTNYLHVGDLYLHFLDDVLVRQLEIFYSENIPTKWAVRRYQEDDSLMYSYGYTSMSRFRSMSLSVDEFESKWTEHTGQEGDMETRQSPILSPNTYNFHSISVSSSASFNSDLHTNSSFLSGVRESTLSQGSITSSNATSPSAQTSALSTPSSSEILASTDNTSITVTINAGAPPAKPALPTHNDSFRFEQNAVIEMDTIELGPLRPPKLHSHQIPIPPAV